jgi:acyl-CoA reductase-like NAD-dependent aldehyde dehydrogenase
MKIINPATEETIREVSEDTPETLRSKAEAARRAQHGWSEQPLANRLGAIARFMDLLTLERPVLARLLSSEMGKPITQAHNELAAMPGRIVFFLQNTRDAIEDEVLLRQVAGRDGMAAPELEERVRYEPLGVVANISAWNYPYFVGSNVFLPALLTGNAVLYKPSEHATLTGLAIADLLHRAGVPQDVFIPLIGAGPVGAALLEQNVDGVFFTGSYATGREVAQRMAARMLPVQLELGGKDPVYICDDVNVERAAAAMAEGAFYNAGQSCCAVERIYVHERIAEAFAHALREKVGAFQVGDPLDEGTYIGPLAREDQLDLLERQVEDARTLNAIIMCGGARMQRRGWFFEPTVITQATHDMKLMREESFGPVIGVQSVRSDDEAVYLMNDTEYGLTAGVYSADRKRAEQLLAQIDAGTAYWNCCDRVSPRLPWTGRKHSGIGTTLSIAGIRAFLQPKAYHLKRA